jgi:hypothetical protein
MGLIYGIRPKNPVNQSHLIQKKIPFNPNSKIPSYENHWYSRRHEQCRYG